jgi:hypothetical protein
MIFADLLRAVLQIWHRQPGNVRQHIVLRRGSESPRKHPHTRTRARAQTEATGVARARWRTGIAFIR